MSDSGRRGLLAGLGVGVAVLVCCTLPTLLAAGALSAVGGILSSPWLWTAAGVALAIALARSAAHVRSFGRAEQPSSSVQHTVDQPPEH